MGRARHLLAPAGLRALAPALVAVLIAGCGSSGSGMSSDGRPLGGQAPRGAMTHTCAAAMHGIGELRVTGMGCPAAAGVAGGWTAKGGCAMRANASRGSCTVGRYRCLAVATGKGVAVSCAGPGRSISFLAGR